MSHDEKTDASDTGDDTSAHAKPVDCRKLADLIGDYVDDQLPGDVRSQVDNHVAQCAPCVAFLKQYRFAPEAVRKMLLQSVPQELESRVLSFLRARCTKKV